MSLWKQAESAYLMQRKFFYRETIDQLPVTQESQMENYFSEVLLTAVFSPV